MLLLGGAGVDQHDLVDHAADGREAALEEALLVAGDLRLCPGDRILHVTGNRAGFDRRRFWGFREVR